MKKILKAIRVFFGASVCEQYVYKSEKQLKKETMQKEFKNCIEGRKFLFMDSPGKNK